MVPVYRTCFLVANLPAPEINMADETNNWQLNQLNNLQNNMIFTNYSQQLHEIQKIRAVAMTNQTSLLIPELVTK